MRGGDESRGTIELVVVRARQEKLSLGRREKGALHRCGRDNGGSTPIREEGEGGRRRDNVTREIARR